MADCCYQLEWRTFELRVLVFSVERDGRGYNPARLRGFNPDFVFVALGAPFQDIFIRERILVDVPSTRLAMGVGGSFDFITGKIIRAPRFIQSIGFEWLWRLLQQPWRFKRIYNAVIVFPLSVIAWEFRRFQYRRNAAALIVNRFNEVLILNSDGRGNYWGLPQGGIERGETIEEGALREVFEETGLSNLEILGSWKDIFQYDWPKHYTNRGYKGQRQSLFVMKYNGNPKLVRTNPVEHKGWRWVKLDRLTREVSKIHEHQYGVFLEKYRELIK